VALLGGVAVTLWINVEPAVLLETPEVQLRMVELYVQVMGVLLGFYGVIITQQGKAGVSHWQWVPVPAFMIYMILELGSFLHVAGVPGVEGFVSGTDWWVYLANFVFLLGIFTFAFALVPILRRQAPD
jgi:hypothetical protein